MDKNCGLCTLRGRRFRYAASFLSMVAPHRLSGWTSGFPVDESKVKKSRLELFFRWMLRSSVYGVTAAG